MNNSDQRNGELAYQTAYDSYVFGKNNGLNHVQHVKNSGRWAKKITTGDGIVIYRDAAGSVAVQTPDGRWHITDARGEYASSSMELEREMPANTMVAKKALTQKEPEEAKERGKEKGDRQIASVSEMPKAEPEPAAKAVEAAALTAVPLTPVMLPAAAPEVMAKVAAMAPDPAAAGAPPATTAAAPATAVSAPPAIAEAPATATPANPQAVAAERAPASAPIAAAPMAAVAPTAK